MYNSLIQVNIILLKESNVISCSNSTSRRLLTTEQYNMRRRHLAAARPLLPCPRRISSCRLRMPVGRSSVTTISGCLDISRHSVWNQRLVSEVPTCRKQVRWPTPSRSHHALAALSRPQIRPTDSVGRTSSTAVTVAAGRKPYEPPRRLRLSPSQATWVAQPTVRTVWRVTLTRQYEHR